MPDNSSDDVVAQTRAELRARAAASGSAGAEVGGSESSGEPRASESAESPASGSAASESAGEDWLLAGALLALGIGVFAATFIPSLWSSAWTDVITTVLLWAAMLVPVLWAFVAGRRRGLLQIRAVDVLYGVVLGALVRIAHGFIVGAAVPPSYTLVDGRLSESWWITDGIGAAFVAPVVEEFFFRGVIVVAVFLLLRRAFGHVIAGVVATLAGAGAFVLAHAAAPGFTVDQALALVLLGLVCAGLVLLTRRIWGAVLVHLVFNASWVALALVGTIGSDGSIGS